MEGERKRREGTGNGKEKGGAGRGREGGKRNFAPYLLRKVGANVRRCKHLVTILCHRPTER
jgi:hypothetical protein